MHQYYLSCVWPFFTHLLVLINNHECAERLAHNTFVIFFIDTICFFSFGGKDVNGQMAACYSDWEVELLQSAYPIFNLFLQWKIEREKLCINPVPFHTWYHDVSLCVLRCIHSSIRIILLICYWLMWQQIPIMTRRSCPVKVWDRWLAETVGTSILQELDFCLQSKH